MRSTGNVTRPRDHSCRGCRLTGLSCGGQGCLGKTLERGWVASCVRSDVGIVDYESVDVVVRDDVSDDFLVFARRPLR